MKAKFLTIVSSLLISCYTFSVSAQEKVYIDKFYKWTTDQTKAKEYAIINKEKKHLFKVEFYTLDGNLKGAGYYSNYTEDPRERVKNGMHTYLYANGKDSLIANYKDNRLEGQSINYYPDGSPQLMSVYKEGRRDGKLIQYYPNGTLRRQEIYKDGECTEGKLFAEDGSELPFEPYEVKAEFPGGVKELMQLCRTANYPAEAIRNKEAGNVIIIFTIDKNGKMQTPRITKSVSPALDKEALRLCKNIAETYTWTPAKIDGKPVNIRYTLPFVFRLPIK